MGRCLTTAERRAVYRGVDVPRLLARIEEGDSIGAAIIRVLRANPGVGFTIEPPWVCWRL